MNEPTPLLPGATAVPTGAPPAEPPPDAEQVIRPATVEDLDAMFQLIDGAARTTTVLPRTRENLAEHLRDFLLAEAGGELLGCGALAVTTRGLAEIKSLVVSERTRGRGTGGAIVRALVVEARRLGLRRVFALTDNPRFFERQGFHRVDKSTLPHKVWTECIRCSKFLNCQEEAVEILLSPPARGETAA